MTGVNFAPYDQDRFLPIMKKKLLNLSQEDREHFRTPDGLLYEPEISRLHKVCPKCEGCCYSFTKDLGGIDYYINTWETCANPDCDWPGYHWEAIESAT